MLKALAQLTDTIPTHLRLKAVRCGPAASTRPDMAFADIGNAIVRYRQAGQGPSLVLAADPPVPLELYDELIALLASRYRVTVFELPGFGASLPRAGFRFSMPGAIAAVGRFLKHIGGGPHHLALPCVLGFIALALARQQPALVQQLVLIQMPDWPGSQQWLAGRDAKGLLRTPVLGQLALAAVRRKRIRAWYGGALGQRQHLAHFTDTTLHNFDHGGCFCLASGFQDFLSDHRGLVAAASQKTLVVWGDADPSHRQTVREATLTLAPNAELVRFADAGHFPELEQAPRFAELIGDFIPA